MGKGTKNRCEELITKATFNQASQSCVYLYTTSVGNINICDFRERSDFSARPSLQLSTQAAHGNQGQEFQKWLNYVSSAFFLANGTQVISRDYMSVKLWDIRSNSGVKSKPIYSAQVTDYMERNLSKLYEQDSLDDEFFLSLNPDCNYVVTGAYNKSAHVIDTAATSNSVVRCKYDGVYGSQAGKLKVYNKEKKLVVA